MALFEKEREDLLKEMRDLPRNSAMRKVSNSALPITTGDCMSWLMAMRCRSTSWSSELVTSRYHKTMCRSRYADNLADASRWTGHS